MIAQNSEDWRSEWEDSVGMVGTSCSSVAFLIGVAVLFSATSGAQAVHAGAGPRGNPEAGAALYRHYCGMCHSTEAGVKIVGPSLHGEMKGPHAKTAAQVRAQTMVGKGLMPSFQGKLNDQEMADLLAYIRKL